MNRQTIAEQILGNISWQTNDKGFCECPGTHLHTNKTGKRACVVYLDTIKPPTIFCCHTSCEGFVAEANAKLRSAIGKENPPTEDYRKSPQYQKKLEEQRRRLELETRARTSLPKVLKENEWSEKEAWHESPIQSQDVESDWRLLLTIFPNDGLIWIGHQFDSGKPEHQNNFKTREEWLKQDKPMGPLTSPSLYKPGSFSRSNQNVLARPFLVVESDILTRDQTCSIFKWLRKFMRLRAIVFSGGKSLHGYFDYPSLTVLAQLEVMLPVMGCDPALFRASQPARLSGVKREDKWQSLVWFGGAA